MMGRRAIVRWCAPLLAASLLWPAVAGAAEVHGISAFGDLKYPPDFKHFDYVNPDAPKGGTMVTTPFSAYRTFDSFNAYIVKGTEAEGMWTGVIAPPGVADIYWDRLMTRALDEPDAVYGLVARSAELGPNRQWVIFHLRPEARFHDGTPIRAEDVANSFHLLVEKGHPRYRLQFRDVETVEVIDPLTVKYTFKEGANTRDLPMSVAILPIFSKAYYESHDFTAATLVPPLSSGPYKVAGFQQGRSVTYERVPDYWGKDLPVNKGRYNFDTLKFEYYRDRTVELEAFKAGTYDFREEYTSKSWVTEYTGPGIDNGWIRKEAEPFQDAASLQAMFLNTRRAKLSDPRVRQALDLAFDYQWTNENIFYSLYKRNDSMFGNTGLDAQGPPGAAELKLLEPYRDQLPPEVFGPAYEPPRSDGPGGLRANLRKAADLLDAAGWKVEGNVRRKDGQEFTLEFLEYEPSTLRYVEPYIRNLERLGIRARARVVDAAQFQALSEDFDYDVISVSLTASLTPGTEIRELFESSAAEAKGTYNFSGISNPVVDDLVEKVVGARTREEQNVAGRALDRVLMWGHYIVPAWHRTDYRIAYWDKFSRPETKPKYARGVIDLWWYDKDKAAKLDAAMSGAR